MMQYGHIYTAFCIIIKLKVMFWKLYTRIYFNVRTFKLDLLPFLHEKEVLHLFLALLIKNLMFVSLL